jgi:peptide chain release factor 2/peptide chain release factor
VLVVSAGRGPAEVRRFVAELGPALGTLLRARGLEVGDVDLEPGSARIAFDGDATVADLVGTHELVDAARGRGARRRWFAGVSVHELGPSVRVWCPTDVEVTATRAGGPGGQHVNTTASAVRATHRPTGLSVRVSGERSQHANRRVALRRLQRRLAERDERAAAKVEHTVWRAHDAVIRGNAVATWRRTRRGLEYGVR